MQPVNPKAPHLVVFIHGFRGEGEGTFLDFPNRLSTILKDTSGKGSCGLVKVIVYPRYETRGELRQAVSAFRTWLADQVKQWCQTALNDPPIPEQDVQVYLCGHSMGGLLAADTVISMHQDKADRITIRGIYAFDTPFFGLHPTLISRQAMDRAEQVTRSFGDATAVLGASMPAARAFSGSRWGTLGAGMALAAAAVGTGVAWYHKEKLVEGLDWVKGHMIFASAVMNEQDMQSRLKSLLDIPNLNFHGVYNKLSKESSRTFIKPPPEQFAHLFTPLSSLADDEISAHTSMFDPEKNTGYYALGKETAAFILDKNFSIKKIADNSSSPVSSSSSSNNLTNSSSLI